MVNISFPGLGIEQFSVNRVAIEIGSLQIRWYGILITMGILLAIAYCVWRSKQEEISFDNLLDMAIYTIIFAIIGARVFYVLMSLDSYDSFLEMIAIWEGGLAIYGAIIAGALTILIFCKIKKLSVLRAYDMVCPAVMIGQIIGRWGNFFNGEAHGTAVLEGDILYFLRMGLSYGSQKIQTCYHPTFLYESLWNLVGFIIINLLYRKKKFDGQIFLMYISWYGFGRMFIEGLRTDSLYIGVFRVSQVIGFLCFVVGAVLLSYKLIKIRRAEITAGDYTPEYSKFTAAESVDTCTADANDEDEELSANDCEIISQKLKNIFDEEDGK